MGLVSLDFFRTGPSNMRRCHSFPFALARLIFFQLRDSMLSVCLYCCSECIGVLGCEWCELDHDQLTALGSPFCATQRDCFGGILGARSPYNDQIYYPGNINIW